MLERSGNKYTNFSSVDEVWFTQTIVKTPRLRIYAHISSLGDHYFVQYVLYNFKNNI